jgi:hypothetical protein
MSYYRTFVISGLGLGGALRSFLALITPALSPNRVRLQKIDSISASCVRMARGISATGERLELSMCQPFDSVARCLSFTTAFSSQSNTEDPFPVSGTIHLFDLPIHVFEFQNEVHSYHSFSLLRERLTQLVTALAVAMYPIHRRLL